MGRPSFVQYSLIWGALLGTVLQQLPICLQCPAFFVENKKLARDGDFLEPLLAVSDQEQRLMPDGEQSVYIDVESQTWMKEDPVPLVATETHSSTFFFCLRYVFLSVFL